MSENKSFPELSGLLSGLRNFDTPARQSPSTEAIAETTSETTAETTAETSDLSNEEPVIAPPIESEGKIQDGNNTLWDAFMQNLRECPARCRKPDRLGYFIDKDIADSISECNIEKRSNSDIINAILRTFLNLNLEQFNQYRQESKTLFNSKKEQL